MFSWVRLLPRWRVSFSKKNSPATMTLTILKVDDHTEKGHKVGYIAVLPPDVIGVVQAGRTSREVAFITAWAPKRAKSQNIADAFKALA